MKKWVCLVIILFSSAALFSITVSIEGGADSSLFDKSETSPLGNQNFTPAMQLPLLGAYLDGTFATYFAYSTGFKIDPLWKNLLLTDLSVSLWHLTFGLGTFWGFEGMDYERIDPGLSGRIGFDFPDLLFLDLRLAASVNVNDEQGRESRNGLSFSFGFWVPNVQSGFFMDNKGYINRAITGFTIDTSVNKLGMRMRFFAKNIPYNITVELGYRTLKRIITDTANAGAPETDTAGSFFGALMMRFRLNNFMEWYFSGEGGMGLAAPAQSVITFTVVTGFTFGTFD